MVYLLEALHYIDEIDNVQIDETEIRIFKELRDKQNKRRLQEAKALHGGGEQEDSEEVKDCQSELEVVLSREQVLKLEAHFVAERMKKHMLHRELLSICRFGIESWKGKDGVELRKDLISFVDKLC